MQEWFTQNANLKATTQWVGIGRMLLSKILAQNPQFILLLIQVDQVYKLIICEFWRLVLSHIWYSASFPGALDPISSMVLWPLIIILDLPKG
jgi:hypothetical protein